MEVPVMLSFGNAGGLRNFQLHEVQSTALLDDVLDQCGPENWRSNMSSLTVTISATKSGGIAELSKLEDGFLVFNLNLKGDFQTQKYVKCGTPGMFPHWEHHYE